MIEMDGLSYSYPGACSPVLRQVDLRVPRGAFALVVGASGSGKSTLLRCLNGLVPHFYGGTISGRLRVAGENPVLRGPRGMSASVGMVFQDPESQFVVDTVEDEVAFALENHAVPLAEMRERVEEALGRLGIAHLRQRRISSLSGGEKQRVALASVLALRPQILALDEPTSQLDPEAAEQLLLLLVQLNREFGLTVILSEHRLERVLAFATQIIALPGDGTLRSGAPRDIGSVDQRPPLVALAHALGWSPLPLTVDEARAFVPEQAAEEPCGPADDGSSQADGQAEIVARNLWYTYGSQVALRELGLQVRKGEIVALMGRNGSGKTTLLKLLVGLLGPTAGSVTVRGLDTRRTPLEELIRVVGYVPQDPNALLFAETVAEELALTRRNHGLGEPLPEGLLDALGIASLLKQYPRDLSVGERQRVAVGAILAAEPQIVLLDEPTRGVDRAQKQAMMRYLAKEREGGRTVILATHDVELVAQAADRIVLLEQGRIVDDGQVREVMLRHPAYCSQVGLLYGGQHLTPASVLGYEP